MISGAAATASNENNIGGVLMRTATGNDLVTQERDRRMLQELKTEIDGLKEKVDAQTAQGS